MIRESTHPTDEAPSPRLSEMEGSTPPLTPTAGGRVVLGRALAPSTPPSVALEGGRQRMSVVNVLVVAEGPDEIAHIRSCLRGLEGDVESVADVRSTEGALRHLQSQDVDLVLAYLAGESDGGPDLVPSIRRVAPTVPIVVIVEPSNERLAIKALHLDAQDYLLKDRIDTDSLRRAIGCARQPDRWHRQYRRLLNDSPDGLLIVDDERFVTFINPSAVSMLGEAPTRVDELPMPMQVHQDEPKDVILGTGRVAEIRSAMTLWSGRSARMVAMRDVTERLVMERTLDAVAGELRNSNGHLAELAETDPLTQVLNRRGVEDALAEELRRMRRTGDSLVAILVDCDDFKGINDSYGHAVGDAALIALTSGVEGALREGDHVGRVGGDEFIVLLPGTSIAEGTSVAEKLRHVIKGTVVSSDAGEVQLSASFAVSSVSPDTVSLEEVLASVNDALKRSKRHGKDRVSSALTPVSASGAWPHRDGVVSRTEFDVDSITLDVVFQGIHRLDDDQRLGSEAFVRGPAGLFAKPVDLFRAAHQQEIRPVLDLRALRASLEQFESCRLDGWHHVNIFPSTLLSTPADRIIELLERSRATGRLCLELSEQQFLGDPVHLRSRVREIRDAGYRIAIDDVGFGRSSVEALVLLEPDVVKVHQRCIRSIATHPGERRRLERLLSLLNAVRADVIVEGVETDEERAILREMGVEFGQGFLWGEPRPQPRAATADA